MIIESSDGFTMCLADVKGGPIISGKTLEEVQKKFNEAYNLCRVVQTMMAFSSHKLVSMIYQKK